MHFVMPLSETAETTNSVGYRVLIKHRYGDSGLSEV